MLELLIAAGGGAVLTCARQTRTGAGLFAGAKIAPGIQLYTVRTVMAKDAAGTLESLSRIGYREVELAGLYGQTPRAMRELLDRYSLTAPSTHVGLPDLRRDAKRVFADAHTLGNRYVVVPWIDESERETLAGYEKIAAELNEFGRAARDAGVRLGYHNHDFELRAINGVVPYDTLLANTDPALVDMELDLFWLAKGAGDPLAYFARHPGRFALVHVKDMTDAGEMVAVGTGSLDFRRVFAQAEAAGIRHAFVEHDEPADPIASARTSFAGVQALLP
jgi:sugar phosphate isomerase/epimerase